MSTKDYLGEVRGERSLLEKIMGYIPGYHGYKEKELRRESDRLVRMDVVNRLKDAKTTFRRRFADPAAVQKLGDNAYKFDALTYRLDRVTQRIDRAVAGYAGMFDAIKVKEDKLDSVIQHDLTFIQTAESIKEDVAKVSAMDPGTDDWKTAMDAVTAKVDDLDRQIDQRANLLRGLQA
jgi:hypothetical protein